MVIDLLLKMLERLGTWAGEARVRRFVKYKTIPPGVEVRMICNCDQCARAGNTEGTWLVRYYDTDMGAYKLDRPKGFKLPNEHSLDWESGVDEKALVCV